MNVKGYYIDTSLIVARYKPADELYEHSNRLFQSKDSRLYISPVTVAELYCVLSRIRKRLEVPVTEEPILDTLVAFVLKDCNLEVRSKSYYVEKALGGQLIRMPLEYYISTRVTDRVKLRTLDLFHLSYAWILRRELKIEGFVTGDEEVLDKSRAIQETLGIKVLHPKRVLK